MAMTAGSVTISGAGVASGNGLAKAIYDDYQPKIGAPAGSAGAAAKQKVADLCNSIAAGIVAHISANAEVTVTVAVADVGLQTSTASGSPTGGPAGTKTLATKGSIA